MTFRPALDSPLRRRPGTVGTVLRRWSSSRNVRVGMGAIALLTNLALLNIKASASNGDLVRVAGTGQRGIADGRFDSAQFTMGWAIETDSLGNVFVGDGSAVRKITPDGQVTTIAGSSTPGFTDGTGPTARFDGARGLAVDRAGNVFVADARNHAIRKITPAGVVTTVAGNGAAGAVDGRRAEAQFNEPTDIALDATNNVIVADSQNRLIRKIDARGNVATLAGPAGFTTPVSLAIDTKGNIFVADFDGALNPSRIAKITPAGDVSTLAGPQTSQAYFLPFNVEVDAQENVIVADTYNNRILSITQSGAITVLAGGPLAGYRDNKTSNAKFHGPEGLASGPNGELFVMDGQKPLAPGSETPILWKI